MSFKSMKILNTTWAFSCSKKFNTQNISEGQTEKILKQNSRKFKEVIEIIHKNLHTKPTIKKIKLTWVWIAICQVQFQAQ